MRFDGETNRQIARKLSLTELSGVTSPAHKGADVSIFKTEEISKVEFAEALDRMELEGEIVEMFNVIDRHQAALMNAVFSISNNPDEYPDQRGSIMAAISDFVDSLGGLDTDLEKQQGKGPKDEDERRRARRRRGGRRRSDTEKQGEQEDTEARRRRRRRGRRSDKTYSKFMKLGDRKFYAEDFAITPDPERPSTWAGMLKLIETGEVSPAKVRRAVAKLERGLANPSLTTDAIRKVRSAYREAYPGAELPDILKIRLTLAATQQGDNNA